MRSFKCTFKGQLGQVAGERRRRGRGEGVGGGGLGTRARNDTCE